MTAFYPDPSWIGSDGLDHKNHDYDEEDDDDTKQT